MLLIGVKSPSAGVMFVAPALRDGPGSAGEWGCMRPDEDVRRNGEGDVDCERTGVERWRDEEGRGWLGGVALGAGSARSLMRAGMLRARPLTTATHSVCTGAHPGGNQSPPEREARL